MVHGALCSMQPAAKPIAQNAKCIVPQVLDAVMKYSDRDDREGADPNGQPVEVLHWAAAIDDTGTIFLLL